jgi:formamidopyrimidine-DNA glycosylase
VPELPEVEAVRLSLAPRLTHARITDVEVRRPDLRVPFPPRFRARVAGQTVTALTRRAKYLLAALASSETLLIHLGMSGSFRVRPAGSPDPAPDNEPAVGADPHDHVVFHVASGDSIAFNDPRRFGLITLLTPRQLDTHPVLSRLGPEPLSLAFDAAALARACLGKTTSLKAALLDQRIVAGLGNIYASEALHAAGLSPRRRAGTIATASGAPREAAFRLADAIKRVLTRAIKRLSRSAHHGSRFRVYDRAGERCLRPGCHGTIRRRAQAGRSTFYCPVCQR